MEEKISIILVNYNGKDYNNKCICSFFTVDSKRKGENVYKRFCGQHLVHNLICLCCYGGMQQLLEVNNLKKILKITKYGGNRHDFHHILLQKVN